MMESIKKTSIFCLTLVFKSYFFFFGGVKNNKTVDKVLDLYKNRGFEELFTKIRFWDAPYIEVEKLCPKSGKIVDLGCGDGLLGNFLALTSSKREIIGIEFSRERIKKASKNINNAKYVYGDILKTVFPYADVFLLVHVLHHLSSFEEQEKLIDKCAKILEKGKKIIIVEINKKFSLKYALVLLTDCFIFPLLFEKKFANFDIFYRNQEQWTFLLKKKGFVVKGSEVKKKYPFPHLILTGIKK